MWYIIVIPFCIISFILLFSLIRVNKNNKILEEEKNQYINNKLEELEKIFDQKRAELEKELIQKQRQRTLEYDQKVEELEKRYNQYQESLKTQLNYSKTSTQTAKDALSNELKNFKATEEQRIKESIHALEEIEKRKASEEIGRYVSECRAAADNLINSYKVMQEEAEQKYKEQREAAEEEFRARKELADQEYKEILEILEDFRKRREVVNQQVLREKEAQENTDFYRIQLTQEEINDLKIIKEVESRFNNKEVLHKAAFDCYIRRPLQEMEKRVLNGKKPSGIYIITYIPTGEIYIGKSTDINNRWQEHCKSAYGVGTIAHSTLHTKMARDGLWNFTFQVLEEVPKEKLGEREKYWIDLYGATSLLNQKQGG